MVSLEEKVKYSSSRINESPKLKAFNDLLYDRIISCPKKDELNESDEIYFGIINSIHSKDKSAFDDYYNRKSRSNPKHDSLSPFVNDDFLIFSLIIGITKFGYDRTWIKNIVSLRSQNPVSITFNNILKEDFYSKSNLNEIVIIYAQLCNLALITDDLLNTGYKSIRNNTNLFKCRNDFEIICALRSYDYIIELKEAPECSKISLLQEFNFRFLKRARYLAWIIQTLILFLLLYLIIIVISFVPAVKKFLSDYDIILSVLGISIFGTVVPIKSIKRKSYEIVLRIFGYPDALVKEINKI